MINQVTVPEGTRIKKRGLILALGFIHASWKHVGVSRNGNAHTEKVVNFEQEKVRNVGMDGGAARFVSTDPNPETWRSYTITGGYIKEKIIIDHFVFAHFY